MIPRHMGQVQNQDALYLLYTRFFARQYVLAGIVIGTISAVWVKGNSKGFVLCKAQCGDKEVIQKFYNCV